MTNGSPGGPEQRPGAGVADLVAEVGGLWAARSLETGDVIATPFEWTDELGRENHRPGGTSSGSPNLESSAGPRKVVISAIPSPSSVSTEMLRGTKLCPSSFQR
jgi:hypothetical protein